MMLSHRSSMFLRPMLGRVFENGGTMMKRFLTIFLTLVLLLGLFALPAGASSATLDTAAKKAAAFAVSSVPHPGAGDDWAVIGAVRGGFDIPSTGRIPITARSRPDCKKQMAFCPRPA